MIKVFLIGRLTDKPISKITKNNLEIANFVIICKDGYIKNKIHSFRCVAYGQKASFINKYLNKGNLVHVDGTINTFSYEKDGEKKFGSHIVIQNLLPISKPNKIKELDKEKLLTENEEYIKKWVNCESSNDDFEKFLNSNDWKNFDEKDFEEIIDSNENENDDEYL